MLSFQFGFSMTHYQSVENAGVLRVQVNIMDGEAPGFDVSVGVTTILDPFPGVTNADPG